jgi:hypothetical protein
VAAITFALKVMSSDFLFQFCPKSIQLNESSLKYTNTQTGNTQLSVNMFKHYRNLQKYIHPKNISFHAPVRLRGQKKSLSSDSHSLQNTGNLPN